ARLAYVAVADGTHALHVRVLANGRDTVVFSDPRLEDPAWAPDGERITWTADGPRGGVYIVPLDGRYVNLVSARHAESAWSPDGRTLTLADIPRQTNVAYNGDPDRTGDREANLLAAPSGGLWTVDAPAAVDEHLIAQAGTGIDVDRAHHNADAFDQLWNRTA